MELDILEKGLEFAKNEYSKRQAKIWDGDPKGFLVLFNNRSKKFSTLSLQSKKIDSLSENFVKVYNVYSNGSCEIIGKDW